MRRAAQVRVVCSSNGAFVRQPSGSFDYEGGEVRLVIVSSASSLGALKEALDRVVNRTSHSKSMSGPPKVPARPALLRPQREPSGHIGVMPFAAWLPRHPYG